MTILDNILNLDELKNKPPVLVDIGASGQLSDEWKQIAKSSICIAFDADKRDIDYMEKESSGYLKLIIFNKIVAEDGGSKRFFLTTSPHCSSSLRPNTDKLKKWAFADLFKVEKEIEIDTVNLPSVLGELQLDYVDWFKTDSQGTDLRLFKSLGEKIISNILVAEFEPGIMDSYIGEDKMYKIMEFMENRPFWLDELNIKGTQRMAYNDNTDKFSKLQRKCIKYSLKTSAFWGEMAYINTFEKKETWNKRDLLLGWIFSTIKQQHGFAYEISKIGQSQFADPVFGNLKKESIASIKKLAWKKLPFYIVKKFIGKLVSLK